MENIVKALFLSVPAIDWKKILTGAGVAGAGALLIYVIEYLVGLNFGVWTPAIVALGGILINIIRKWIASYAVLVSAK